MLGYMEETYIGKKGQLMTTRDGKPYALQTKTGKEIKHGTSNAYRNHGCRCINCVDAEAAYRRGISLSIFRDSRIQQSTEKERKIQNRFSVIDGRVVAIFTKKGNPVVHGSASTYTNCDCRCSECSAAHRELVVKKYHKDIEKSRAYNRDYSAEYKKDPKNKEKLRTRELKYRSKKNAYAKEYHKENPAAQKMKTKRDNTRRREKDTFSKSHATRHGLPYTKEEDALLLSVDQITLAEALSLGRSLGSLRARKTVLLRSLRQGKYPETRPGKMQPLDNQD